MKYIENFQAFEAYIQKYNKQNEGMEEYFDIDEFYQEALEYMNEANNSPDFRDADENNENIIHYIIKSKNNEIKCKIPELLKNFDTKTIEELLTEQNKKGETPQYLIYKTSLKMFLEITEHLNFNFSNDFLLSGTTSDFNISSQNPEPQQFSSIIASAFCNDRKALALRLFNNFLSNNPTKEDFEKLCTKTDTMKYGILGYAIAGDVNGSNKEFIDLLLANAGKDKLIVTKADVKLAVELGRLDLLQAFHKASPEVFKSYTNEEENILNVAIEKGNLDIIGFFLNTSDTQYLVNLYDDATIMNLTPLLLTLGNVGNNHNNPDQHKNSKEILQQLLNNLKFLKENNVNVNFYIRRKNSDFSNSLHIAAHLGLSEVVDQLLALDTESGKDKLIYSINGSFNKKTPLHFAAMTTNDSESLKIITSLLNAGAEIDAVDAVDISDDKLGTNTPIHLALEAGNHNAVMALVNAGANLEIKNAEGKTALDLATEKADLFKIVEVDGKKTISSISEETAKAKLEQEAKDAKEKLEQAKQDANAKLKELINNNAENLAKSLGQPIQHDFIVKAIIKSLEDNDAAKQLNINYVALETSLKNLQLGSEKDANTSYTRSKYLVACAIITTLAAAFVAFGKDTNIMQKFAEGLANSTRFKGLADVVSSCLQFAQKNQQNQFIVTGCTALATLSLSTLNAKNKKSWCETVKQENTKKINDAAAGIAAPAA